MEHTIKEKTLEIINLKINKNKKLPLKLSGIVNNTMNGFIKSLNWINIMTKIIMIAKEQKEKL